MGFSARASTRSVLWLLVLVTSVEALLAGVIRGHALVAWLSGEGSAPSRVMLLGMFWLPALALALVLAARKMLMLADAADTATAQLNSAAATTRDWFWRIDLHGRITYTSPTSRAVVGMDPHDLIGRSALDLVHPDDLAAARRRFADALATGTGWDDELLRLVSADGGVIAVEQSALPALDPAGRLVGFRGSCRIARAETLAAATHARSRQRIRTVIDTVAFRPAMQPIVSVLEGRVVGVEALTRFDATPYEAPDVWFARARAAGIGPELELAALRRALAAADAVPSGLYFSFNASPDLVTSGDVARVLGESAVPLDRLVLELTEHESIDDYGRLADALRPLRAKGLRVAVDDAGAGYSSFAHIVRLRPDIIKLDGDLVRHVADDAARRALISSVVIFALELPAIVTAEGVESASQLETLAMLGIDAAQGFELGMPTTDQREWRRWGPVTQVLDVAQVTAIPVRQGVNGSPAARDQGDGQRGDREPRLL